MSREIQGGRGLPWLISLHEFEYKGKRYIVPGDGFKSGHAFTPLQPGQFRLLIKRLHESYGEVPYAALKEASEEQWEEVYRKLEKEGLLQKETPRVPVAGKVYVLKDGRGLFKIGRTKAKKPQNRLSDLLQHPEIELVHLYDTSDYVGEEERLHKKYEQYKVSGGWFKLPPEALEGLLAEGQGEVSQ